MNDKIRLVESHGRTAAEVAGRVFANIKSRAFDEPADFRSRGFHLYLENRWIISVQWGDGAYGTNYNRTYNDPPTSFQEEVTTAEVAVFQENSDEMATFADGDTVQGWITAEQLLVFIDEVAAWSSDDEKRHVLSISGG